MSIQNRFIQYNKNHCWQYDIRLKNYNIDLKEANLDGMMSRIVQHEYDHILGKNFTDYASKMKLDRAYKKAEKDMDRARKLQKASGVDK